MRNYATKYPFARGYKRKRRNKFWKELTRQLSLHYLTCLVAYKEKTLHKITETGSSSSFSQHNLKILLCLKASSKKTAIQIRPVGMSVIF
jgi:hypothetical protein